MARVGIDPFTMGIISMLAGSNPEQAGPLLDSMGLPVPKLPSAGGIPVTPAAAAAEPQVAGALQEVAPQANPLVGIGAKLQGVKAPNPVAPVMSGGVAGGVKPPEVTAMKAGSPAIQALMQALLARSAGPAVPGLGELIRNVRP